MLALGLVTVASPAAAEGVRGFAPDGFEPSERGSAWSVADSLDLRGDRPAFGVVTDYTHRRLALRTPEGAPQPTPVANALYAHLGASYALKGRVRIAASLPLQLFVDGEASEADPLPPPPTDQGIGDARLGGDVRLFGAYGDVVTVAAGVQAWVPTGSTAQYAGGGDVRVRPRVMLAGERGAFVYAAEIGARYRGRSEIVGGVAIGSDVGVTLAAGARLLARRLLVGVELYGSTVLSDPLGARATPLEALVSARHAIGDEVRVGVGVGTGLLRGAGAPMVRALLSLEWAPPPPASATASAPRGEEPCEGGAAPGCRTEERDPAAALDTGAEACAEGTVAGGPDAAFCVPDEDGDGIDDLSDACPTVPGVRTDDPHDNGCPNADPDADGIVSELDACPGEAGLKDPDPTLSGCPLVFARGARLELRVPLSFGQGSAEVDRDPKNAVVLAAIARYLAAKPDLRLRVEGHTHDRVAPAVSATLSAARAEAVVRWLVTEGVDASRLASQGAGFERPLRSNETEAGRRANDRVELYVER